MAYLTKNDLVVLNWTLVNDTNLEHGKRYTPLELLMMKTEQENKDNRKMKLMGMKQEHISPQTISYSR